MKYNRIMHPLPWERPFVRPRRSVAECLALDADIVLKGDRFYKEVTRDEADDLWCVGETLLFNSVPSATTFWEPLRLSKSALKHGKIGPLRLDALTAHVIDDLDMGRNVSFKTVCEIARLNLPKGKSLPLHFFVEIKVRAKKTARHAV